MFGVKFLVDEINKIEACGMKYMILQDDDPYAGSRIITVLDDHGDPL